ncbi:MAG: helix-turn-helix domain-containing protein [Pseudohongiella sp.]|nr:helix-turn-helix domain-containing protein [Pseudohongiella sp.]
MGRHAAQILLDEHEEAELNRWLRRRNKKVGLYLRAGIVLDCARGLSGDKIAEKHKTSQQTVCKWRRRFAWDRLADLSDAPYSGQPRKHDDDKAQSVLDAETNVLEYGALLEFFCNRSINPI